MQKVSWSSSDMLKFVVLITAIRLLLLSSYLTMPAAVSKRSNVQICGRALAQTLNLVCGGEYYDPGEQNVISKRDVAQQLADYLYPGWFLRLPSLKIDRMSHHQYLSQYPIQYQSSLRQQRGVVDDCCKKSCSMTVLMSYCRSA